jgi:hypothetical protein
MREVCGEFGNAGIEGISSPSDSLGGRGPLADMAFDGLS